MAARLFSLVWLGVLLRCSAQGAFSGVWHLVDVLSVVCPSGPGHATLTIQKPTTSEYEPHIFTVFRTAQSSVGLSFIAKDALGKVVTDQLSGVTLHPASAPYRRLSEQHLRQQNSSEAAARRLFGSRRRFSSGSRRRTGGGGGGINLNPTTWFSPRRRRVSTGFGPTSPVGVGSPRRRMSAVPGATSSSAYAAGGGSVRRRGTTSATGGYGYSSYRRRRTNIGGSSSGYSNPYSSSYMGSYGYPSSAYAMQAFGGHTPMSTSYGYSGMNAYQGSSGTSIAMAGGAGLLAGYIGGSLMHPYYHHHGYSWGGYTRQDLYGMPCTSGPWSGSCSSCVSLYGGSSCNVMMSPKIDATRDDLMSTGFAPSEVTWPLTVNITHVSGSDFNPSVVCPPSKNAGDWQPPEMKQLFLTLTSLSQPSAQRSYAGGYAGGHEEGGGGLFSLLVCCGCLGGMYFCASKKNQEYQYGGPDPMGPLPGYQGGFAQPAQNPYWQGGAGGAGGAEGTQLTSQPGGFMSTAAPNGKSWSDYCGRTEPEIGPNGSLTGRWAECLAWAVVFEHQDTSWERDPRYQTGSGGPAGSVIEAAIAKAPASKVRDVGKAADALEDECRLAVREKRPLPVINERA